MRVAETEVGDKFGNIVQVSPLLLKIQHLQICPTTNAKPLDALPSPQSPKCDWNLARVMAGMLSEPQPCTTSRNVSACGPWNAFQVTSFYQKLSKKHSGPQRSCKRSYTTMAQNVFKCNWSKGLLVFGAQVDLKNHIFHYSLSIHVGSGKRASADKVDPSLQVQ